MKRIIYILAFLTPITTNAEISLCDTLPKIFHINGITTERDSAIESANQLKQLTKEKNGDAIETNLAYNHTNGFFADIQQTFYQLKMQDPNTQDEKIAEALLGSIPPDMNMQVAEAAKKYYLEKQELAALAQLTIDEQSEIIQDIKSNIQAGVKVLLVPHSQGNLFANSTYTRLTSNEGVKPEDIKIFGVASPADRVLGNGAYLTSKSDVVIQSLAKIPFLNVLPRQLNLPISGADPLGHGFKEIYLNGAMAGRDAVWTGIEQQIFALNQSPNPLYQGKVYERAPIIMSFYGVNYDQAEWINSGWGPQNAANGLPHIIAQNNEYREIIDSKSNYKSIFSTVESVFNEDRTINFNRSIMCNNYPLPDGAKINSGTYEVRADFRRLSRIGSPNSLIDIPSGFSIQVQGRFHNYQFRVSQLRRSPLDDFMSLATGSIDHPETAFSGGTMNYILGFVQVSQDLDTGRYSVIWQPTSELEASKVIQ
ncbi:MULTISPECIES: hypothetical protein [Deefgea]|uniref:Uncharacterized protein n=1 Tax=Deefgea chitinilytica TaxID=570276 RepID=A0ABS2CBS3_9NEIS|nr:MULTISPECIES: hypothetical protein [Deefgea]MBM5571605.1 hypothetical protein [Deefgea chitinilytica]MBM9888840.1 hypothetical protein [Deefgea sp. CFH1-16]